MPPGAVVQPMMAVPEWTPTSTRTVKGVPSHRQAERQLEPPGRELHDHAALFEPFHREALEPATAALETERVALLLERSVAAFATKI